MNNTEGLERDAQIHEIMECKKEIIICKRDIAIIALKLNLIKNRVICHNIMKEIYIPSVQVYIVSYGSPFLNRFDGIVHRLHANGIFSYWEKGPTIYGRRKSGKMPHRLSLDAFFVAFVVLGVGLLTSTLVFLSELRSV